MNTLTGTPKELETLTGLNQAFLSTLLRLAEKNGAAKIVKQNKPARGKPSNVWEVSTSLVINLPQ